MKLNLKRHIIEEEIIKSNIDFICDNNMIGREHYPLFICIASQINNSQILEIGTCTGASIYAFSNHRQENNNKLFTYDIIDTYVKKDLINKSGADFKIIDMLEPTTREINKEHILNSDIIFIDIDPHTGIKEYEMICWLKKNNFNGIIILDDIYLAKPGHEYEHRKCEGHYMYQNLWIKIPDNEKMCISHLGHSSGTGIVCFDFSKHEINVT